MESNEPNDEFKNETGRNSDYTLDDELERSMQRGLSDGIVIANRLIVVCLSLAFPLGLGWWLGNRWELGIVGLLVGLTLGMIASGYQLMNMVSWLNRRAAEKSASQRASKPKAVGKETFQTSPNEANTSHGSNDDSDPWEARWREKWDDDPAAEDK